MRYRKKPVEIEAVSFCPKHAYGAKLCKILQSDRT